MAVDDIVFFESNRVVTGDAREEVSVKEII